MLLPFGVRASNHIWWHCLKLYRPSSVCIAGKETFLQARVVFHWLSLGEPFEISKRLTRTRLTFRCINLFWRALASILCFISACIHYHLRDPDAIQIWRGPLEIGFLPVVVGNPQREPLDPHEIHSRNVIKKCQVQVTDGEVLYGWWIGCVGMWVKLWRKWRVDSTCNRFSRTLMTLMRSRLQRPHFLSNIGVFWSIDELIVKHWVLQNMLTSFLSSL